MRPFDARRRMIFSDVPLISAFASKFGTSAGPLSDVALVGVQHLLETTGSLLECLIRLGLQPENIFIAGKIYSTCPNVQEKIKKLGIYVQNAGLPRRWGCYENQLTIDVSKLWEVAARRISTGQIRKVVVLDDGGCALANIPKELGPASVVGVEQTMGGIALQTAGHVRVPVVEVAASAVKRLVEPYLIQKAIFKRVLNTLRSSTFQGTFGIVGYGNIGSAVADALLTLKKQVLVFDHSEEARTAAKLKQIPTCTNFKDLVTASDVLFGCAGQDAFADTDWWRAMEGHKIFVSCSSLDSEFRTPLRSLGIIPKPVYPKIVQDVVLEMPHGLITVLGGGFPINFDRSPESVPLEEIQLTRTLLLAGVLQAAAMGNDQHFGFRDVSLSSSAQQWIVNRWFSMDRSRELWYKPATLETFTSTEMIERYSQVENQSPVPATLT